MMPPSPRSGSSDHLVSSDTSVPRTDDTRVHSVTYVHAQVYAGSFAKRYRGDGPASLVHRLSSSRLEGHACHTHSATHNDNTKVSASAAGQDSFLNNVCSAPLLRLWPDSGSVTGVVRAFRARFRARQRCEGSGAERCGGGSPSPAQGYTERAPNRRDAV